MVYSNIQNFLGTQTGPQTTSSSSGLIVSPGGIVTAEAFGVPTVSVAPSTPLGIITSVPIRAWLRPDLGVTIATGVSAWVDQTANAYSFIQATAGNQPARNLTDSTLNNLPTITGDGSNDVVANAAIVIAASFWMCLVVKAVSWAVNGQIIQTAGGPYNSIGMYTGTPQIFGVEGGSATPAANLTVGAWKRVTFQENNTTADGLLVGATSSTGTALGRTVSRTGLNIFGTNSANVAIAEILITDGIPTSGEKTAIDAYLNSRYATSSLFT